MSWRETLQRVAALPPIRRSVRAVTRSRFLPTRFRTAVFRKVAVHIPIIGDFERGGIRFSYAGSARLLYWLDCYEPTTLDLFLRYAETARTILDVGARDGVIALHAAASNPDALVLAFEPDPTNFAQLEANLARNPGLVIEAQPVALSNSSGPATFYSSGGTSSLNAAFRPRATPITVSVTTGDDFVAANQIEGVDLVKIDTESTEPDVLDGLATVIARDRPVIFCEVLAGRTEKRLNEWARGHAYQPFWITSRGPQAVDTIVGDPTYRFPNYLLVPGAQLANHPPQAGRG